MINKIEITSDFKTISKGFVLELGDITVITGENNSGKTNLIKAINDKNANFVENKININPEIIYTEKYCKLRKKCLRFLSDKEKFDCEFFEPQHHRPLNST